MLLAIDSGNTNVVFAVFDGDRSVGVWRCANNPKRTSDEYAVWLTQLMGLSGLAPSDIHAVIVASVVPEAQFNLIKLCERYFPGDLLVVGSPQVDLPLQVLVDRPDQVGADRLVNTVAAYNRFGGNLIIVDFGTATTFDIVNADGAYVGGVIAPGINLSIEALYMAAAQLPRVAVRRPDKVIGKATVPAMQSGVFWGYVGMIEGLVERIRKEYGDPLQVLATGGLAPLFAEATDVIGAIDSDMTVRGLLEIYRHNRSA